MVDLEVANQIKANIPLLNALADENRMRILTFLAGQNFNVNQISENFAITRPAISHHLTILKQAGIIEINRQGKENYYQLDLEFLIDRLLQLTENLGKLLRNV